MRREGTDLQRAAYVFSRRERITALAILKTIGFLGRDILLLILAESALSLALGHRRACAGGRGGRHRAHAEGAHLPMAPIAWAIRLRASA
ncbi:MAG: hypothetical protein ACRET2_05740 [Steroidobacteraceae bacterium]